MNTRGRSWWLGVSLGLSVPGDSVDAPFALGAIPAADVPHGQGRTKPPRRTPGRVCTRAAPPARRRTLCSDGVAVTRGLLRGPPAFE